MCEGGRGVVNLHVCICMRTLPGVLGGGGTHGNSLWDVEPGGEPEGGSVASNGFLTCFDSINLLPALK